MSVSPYDAVADKVLTDLEATIKRDPSINEFYIVPTAEEENKNSSPILKGENTLGLESWIVRHLYLYAHRKMMQKNSYRNQNLSKVIPCLTGVALLNPEMPTVWNRRRELIIARRMVADDELRLTRMALSRKPKCNDVLVYRKWIITEILKDVEDKSELLLEELKLSEMIANRYHSNYHAWSHRMWSLQHLFPQSTLSIVMGQHNKNSFFSFHQVDLTDILGWESFRPYDLSVFVECQAAQVYFGELDTNFRWISSHVSDHSGLHFRKFLLAEILALCKNYFSQSMKNDQTWRKVHNDNPQLDGGGQHGFTAFTTGRANLTEYLLSQDLGEEYKQVVDEYLTKLEEELNCLDLALLLLATELKSNFSLCLVYPSHEALWYYRRFLVSFYKRIVKALNVILSQNTRRVTVHQDQNGVPCRKDFKYDDEVGVDSLKCSDLYASFSKRLLLGEEDLVKKLNSQNESVRKLLRNYTIWLRHCFDDEDEGVVFNPEK
ncbi:hypothetical protein RUM44_005970 [Polyplax serrata]|uniref:Protein prenyltransferase alpha subunit repeat-containing protein 1 n=1 Tax=Polyplax serrata TaxID=468196 RepID=A0ABR1AYM0_POLSC